MVAFETTDMMGRIKDGFTTGIKLKKEESYKTSEIDLDDPNIPPMKKLQMFLKQQIMKKQVDRMEEEEQRMMRKLEEDERPFPKQIELPTKSRKINKVN